MQFLGNLWSFWASNHDISDLSPLAELNIPWWSSLELPGNRIYDISPLEHWISAGDILPTLWNQRVTKQAFRQNPTATFATQNIIRNEHRHLISPILSSVSPGGIYNNGSFFWNLYENQQFASYSWRHYITVSMPWGGYMIAGIFSGTVSVEIGEAPPVTHISINTWHSRLHTTEDYFRFITPYNGACVIEIYVEFQNFIDDILTVRLYGPDPNRAGAFKLLQYENVYFEPLRTLVILQFLAEANTEYRIRLYSNNGYFWYNIRAGLLPVSGGEVPFEYWPAGQIPHPIHRTASHPNCYSFALNWTFPGFGKLRTFSHTAGGIRQYVYWPRETLEPGDMFWDINHTYIPTHSTIDRVINFAKLDADNANWSSTFREVGRFDRVNPDEYKVALAFIGWHPISGIPDYHFYRQNDDGTWSHKIGHWASTIYDSSGNIIFDPYHADRTILGIYLATGEVFRIEGFEYSTPRYFAVRGYPGNNPFVFEQANIQPTQANVTPLIQLMQLATRSEFITFEQVESLYSGISIESLREILGAPHGAFGSGVIREFYLVEDGSRLVIDACRHRNLVRTVMLIDTENELHLIIE